MCYGDTFTKYNHITLSFIHPQFILHQESFFLAVICAYLQIYEYGHGKHFQGKSLIKFFYLPSSSRCPRRRATLRRKRWKSEERRGGGGLGGRRRQTRTLIMRMMVEKKSRKQYQVKLREGKGGRFKKVHLTSSS